MHGESLCDTDFEVNGIFQSTVTSNLKRESQKLDDW
jgi:hypothetical protein